MDTWLTRLLICVLVATTLFVAAVSGCHPGPAGVESGGSCSERQWEPMPPLDMAPDVTLPTVVSGLFLLAAILVAASAPKPTRTVPPAIRSRWRACFGTLSRPFYRDVYLPYLCAMRDP